jgi:hypothetical protein
MCFAQKVSSGFLAIFLLTARRIPVDYELPSHPLLPTLSDAAKYSCFLMLND